MLSLPPRRLACALALSLLCLPAARAQTPTLAPPAAYHWHAIVLHHAAPSDVLSVMHWDGMQQLPGGVLHIQSFPSSNALMLEATDAGFAAVRQSVKILDIAPFEMEPTLLSLNVPANEAGLNWNVSQPLPIEMLSGTQTNRAFARLVQAGHVPIKVKRQTVKLNDSKPQTWDLPEYRLQNPRLNSDDSIQLQVALRNPLPDQKLPFLFTAPTPHLQRDDVLALRTKDSAPVTFIKVED